MRATPPADPITTSPAAAFELLLERSAPIPLREFVQEREWNRRILGATLQHLRSLGLAEVEPGSEPARIGVTPWARKRANAVGAVLASRPSPLWAATDRELLRPQVESALEQRPGCLLVYASDGTERLDFDFKGYRSIISNAEWLQPDSTPQLLDVSNEAVARVRDILSEHADRERLMVPGMQVPTRPGKRAAPIFEVRPGGHLRFRPVERETGRLLRRARDGESAGMGGDGNPSSGDEKRRQQLAQAFRTALALETTAWQVRATPGINTIDLFPQGHDKALARDHLLTTGPGGQGRQVVSIADRIDGNDAPLFTRPLPVQGCRYLFLSVASDAQPIELGFSRGLVPPGLRIGHLGTGSRRTERFLNRLLALCQKGMTHVAALVRTLQEEQQNLLGPHNLAAAAAVDETWDPGQPITLAFDIDGTLNEGEGTMPVATILQLLWELDRWGFQLAVVTGKTMVRLQEGGMLGLQREVQRRSGNPVVGNPHD